MSYSGDLHTDDMLELSEQMIASGDLTADDIVDDSAHGMFDYAARDAYQKYRDLQCATPRSPRLDELDEQGYVMRVRSRKYAAHI